MGIFSSKPETMTISKDDIIGFTKRNAMFYVNNERKVYIFDEDLLIHVDLLIHTYYQPGETLTDLEVYYNNNVIYGFSYNNSVYTSRKISPTSIGWVFS